MEIFKEGDKSKAICEHCKKISNTTFEVKTANIQDGNKTLKVPDILVAVCDSCHKVAAIPQQSYAAVAEHKKKDESKTQEYRVPRHLLDILNNSISSVGLNASKDLRGKIIRYYIASWGVSKSDINLLKRNLKSDLLEGNFRRGSRLSMRFSSELNEHLTEVVDQSHLSKTDVFDSVIVQIKEDVLDKKDPGKIGSLRTFLMG